MLQQSPSFHHHHHSSAQPQTRWRSRIWLQAARSVVNLLWLQLEENSHFTAIVMENHFNHPPQQDERDKRLCWLGSRVNASASGFGVWNWWAPLAISSSSAILFSPNHYSTKANDYIPNCPRATTQSSVPTIYLPSLYIHLAYGNYRLYQPPSSSSSAQELSREEVPGMKWFLLSFSGGLCNNNNCGEWWCTWMPFSPASSPFTAVLTGCADTPFLPFWGCTTAPEQPPPPSKCHGFVCYFDSVVLSLLLLFWTSAGSN